MNYRLYQDMANAHITQLEREAQDARLAGHERAHVKSTLSTLTGLPLRLIAQLRRHHGLHGFGLRTSTNLSLGPLQCEFDAVADHSSPACEEVGGANDTAGSPGRWTPRNDSTLRFEENHVDNTGITNIELQMSLREDEIASKKTCNAVHFCCASAS
jgi:hypothetical protein